MAVYMLDTSGLIKYYTIEIGSKNVEAIINDSTNQIFISDLSIVELVSTLAKKVRMKAMGANGFHLARRRFFADIVANKFNVEMLRQEHGRSAINLLVKHATKRGLRTLDALQLAIAIDPKSRRGLDGFVCADDKLAKIIKLEKIAFVDPEVL